MSENDQDFERLQAAAAALGEYFDTVQIFVTRHENSEGTTNMNWGSGNWFARYGQVEEWVSKTRERSLVQVRQEED